MEFIGLRAVARNLGMLVKSACVVTLACLSSLVVAGPNEVVAEATGESLVTVNGERVSKQLYAAYFNERSQNQPTATRDSAQQLAILNELVNFLLLAQDAVDMGLDRRPQVAAELKLARSKLLANTAIRERLTSQPVSESALRQAYAEQFKGKALNEYKLSHILVDSQQAAEKSVSALNDGRPFADVARQNSIDASAQSGGELGWVSRGQLDPALVTALADLQPGTYSQQPVETEFGWHVLLLEQVRASAQPSYAEMRASLMQAKQKELLTAYIKELRAKAQLELKALAPAANDARTPDSQTQED